MRGVVRKNYQDTGKFFKKFSYHTSSDKHEIDFIKPQNAYLVFLQRSLLKIAIFFAILTMLGWIGIKSKSIATSVSSFFIGDFESAGRVLLMTVSEDKEKISWSDAWDIGRGKTAWLKNENMVYIGNGIAIMKNTAQGILQHCKLNSCLVDLNAYDHQDANDFCDDNYQKGRLPTKQELEKTIGSKNPLFRSRIRNNTEYMEWTSTQNKNNDEEYHIYTKTSKHLETLMQKYPRGDLKFLDEDLGKKFQNLSFRCVMEKNDDI